MIFAAGRRIALEAEEFVRASGFEVVPVDASAALRIGNTYRRWGKGFHPAALNFGDCFAYDLAISRDCPLLFVGDDFARTDVRCAIEFR